MSIANFYHYRFVPNRSAICGALIIMAVLALSCFLDVREGKVVRNIPFDLVCLALLAECARSSQPKGRFARLLKWVCVGLSVLSVIGFVVVWVLAV